MSSKTVRLKSTRFIVSVYLCGEGIILFCKGTIFTSSILPPGKKS